MAENTRRSLPWLSSEYLVIDGIPRIYDLRDGACIVHLPGGVDVSLTILRCTGHAVTEPKRWRVEHYT